MMMFSNVLRHNFILEHWSVVHLEIAREKVSFVDDSHSHARAMWINGDPPTRITEETAREECVSKLHRRPELHLKADDLLSIDDLRTFTLDERKE